MNLGTEIEELILKLANITLQCLDRLDIITYEELQQFLVNREQLILRLAKYEISDEQKVMYRDQVAEILKQDEVIVAKMNSFKASAGQEIARMKASRKQKHAYETHLHDSYFIDKKK